jgi:hypothetical protein
MQRIVRDEVQRGLRQDMRQEIAALVKRAR